MTFCAVRRVITRVSTLIPTIPTAAEATALSAVFYDKPQGKEETNGN